MDNQKLAKQNLIVKCLAGSHAYGTNTETSDVDYRGIFVGTPLQVRTPFFKVGTVHDKSEQDTDYYELSQYFELVTKQNPNVVELLWVDESDIVLSTPVYEELRKHRDMLLSSKIAFTMSGYAFAQLKRIKGHQKWITNPQPVDPPRQIDYISLVQNFDKEKRFKIDLSEFRYDYRLIPYGGEIYGLYSEDGYTTYSDDFTLNTTYEGNVQELGIPKMIVKFNKQVYNEAKEKWSQYWEWKKNRNPARAALEEKNGIDTKHALHLIRLVKMAEEALTQGIIIVKRPDAQELLDIRDGKWSYEKIVSYAEEKDKHIREVLYKQTSLPREVDLIEAGHLLIKLQDMAWTQKNSKNS